MAGLGIAERKKPAPLTIQQIATRVAKAEATRKARGTTSKKQKASVVGDVTGVNITPVVAGSAPSAPALAAGSTAAGAEDHVERVRRP